MSEDDKLTIRTISVPMSDTGIGKAAGYRDDAHLLEVAKAERDALPPEVQAIANEIDRRVDHALIFGSDSA